MLFAFSNEARADCTNPDAKEKKIAYNDTTKIYQYCDGTNWRAMLGTLAVDPSLKTLTDIDDGMAPVTGDVLSYDSASGKWTSAPGGIGVESDPQVASTANGQWCRGNGSSVTCDQTPPMPSGAVLAFDLASCPAGWSPLANGAGRVLIGTGTLGSDSYALGATGGEARHALSVAELASHYHSVNPPNTASTNNGNHIHNVNPPNTTTDSNGNHNHSYDTRSSWDQRQSGSSAQRYWRENASANTGNAGAHTHTVNIPAFDSGSAPNHSHSVNISAFDSDTTGNGDAHENRQPYLALLYCRKD